MKTFWTLFKVDLLNSFSLNSMFSKNKRNKNKRKASSLGSIILTILFLLIFATIYELMFFNIGIVIDKPELCMTFGISVGVMMTLFLTFSNAYSILFKSKDFDLLMTLPIKTKTVVASKILSVTLSGYTYFLCMYLPSMLIYYIGCGINYNSFSLISLLMSLIILFVGPLLVTAICSFIAYLFGIIISKFKYKNIISSILYTLFMIALIVLVYSSSFTMGYNSGSSDAEAEIMYATTCYEMFTKIYPLTKYIIEGIISKPLYVLAYTLVSIGVYYVFALVISKNYLRINTGNKTNYKTSGFKLSKDNKDSSAMKTLISKEFKTFVGNPTYLTNGIIGPIMSCIAIIALSFLIKNKVTSDIIEKLGFNPIILIPGGIIAIDSFFNGMAPITSCSISMEGKNFWITKSLPIEPKKLLLSKLLLNFILYAPFTIIGSITAVCVLKFNVLDSILVIIIPLLANIMYGSLGLLTNLKHYNLNWTNPNVVIKQGSSTLISMLIDFGISILIFVPTIAMGVLGYSSSILVSIIIIILFVISILTLKGTGIKRYNRIEI